jgi:hypothetical protein
MEIPVVLTVVVAVRMVRAKLYGCPYHDTVGRYLGVVQLVTAPKESNLYTLRECSECTMHREYTVHNLPLWTSLWVRLTQGK